MHADRANRSGMLLLAVILIAAGGLGAATSFGLFGAARKHKMLADNPVWTYYGAHGDWMWPITALVALVLVVLALRWLRALLVSSDRSGDLRIATEKASGRTTVSPTAITDAVAGEIRSYRGVAAAKARLIGDPDEPLLVVTATLEDSVDLVALRRRIETQALAHARQALDRPSLAIQLDLNVTSKQAARVG